MAEPLFSSDLSAPQAQGATTVAPVEPVNYGSVFKTLGTLAEGVAKYTENKAKADAEARKNQVVSQFVDEHDRLEQAHLQGKIDSSTYNVRSQATFRRYAASNPEFLDDIKKAAGGLKDYGGLGDVQDDVSAAKNNFRVSVASAQKDGFDVSLNDPIEYQQQIVKQHRLHTLNVQRAEEERKARGEARSEAEFSRSQHEFGLKQDEIRTLNTFITDRLPELNALQSLIGDQYKGASPDQQRLLLARWDKKITDWNAAIAMAGGRNPEMASAVRSMISDLDNKFKDRLSGKLSAETLKNTNEIYLNMARGNILSDPESARLIAQISWAPNAFDAIIQKTSDPNIIKKTFGNLTKPNAQVDVSNPEELKATVETFTSMYNSDRLTPEEKDKLFQTTGNNILRGLGNTIVRTGDDKAIVQALQFIKNPMFVDNIKNMDQGAYNAAKHAVNSYYNRPIVTSISSSLNKPINPPLQRATYLEAIDIVADDTGIKLVPKSGTDPMTQFYTKAIQSSLNDLVIANAHLDGTKDYKSYWERNRGYLFPEVYGHPDVLKPGDVVNGKEFIGGYVNDPKNWKAIDKNRSSSGKIGGQPTDVSNASSGKIGGAASTKSTTSVGKIQ